MNYDGSTILVFHTWLKDKLTKDSINGRSYIYDMDKHIKRRLSPNITLSKAEINWIPLEMKGRLYFVYSLDPLRVMKCDKESGDCEFIYEQPGSAKNPFDYEVDHLRGGTPWTLYKYPYYISFAHNVLKVTKPDKPKHLWLLYNANFVVLSVDPWAIVYVSRNLEFDNVWMQSEPILRNTTITSSFFYPTGLIMWDEDTVDVSGHLNDASGHILRMRGFKKLMMEVMSKTHSPSSSSVRTVQQYLLSTTKEAGLYHTIKGDLMGQLPE